MYESQSLAPPSKTFHQIFGDRSVPYASTPFAKACRSFPALERGASNGQVNAAREIASILESVESEPVAIGLTGISGGGKSQLLKVLQRLLVAEQQQGKIEINLDDPSAESPTSSKLVYLTSLQAGASFPPHLIEGRRLHRVFLKGFNAQELSERFWVEGQSSAPGWLIKRVVADGLGSYSILSESVSKLKIIEKKLRIRIPQDVEPPFFDKVFYPIVLTHLRSIMEMSKDDRDALIRRLEPPREDRLTTRLTSIVSGAHGIDSLISLRRVLAELATSLRLEPALIAQYKRLIEQNPSEPRIVITLCGSSAAIKQATKDLIAMRQEVLKSAPIPSRASEKNPVVIFNGGNLLNSTEHTSTGDSIDFLEDLLSRYEVARTEMLNSGAGTHILQSLINEHYLAEHVLRLALHTESVGARYGLMVDRSLPFRK